jgi:biopolymer transport protein ExbB
MIRFLLVLLVLSGTALGSAQEALASPPPPSPEEAYRKAADSIDADLRAALDELASVRATIAGEKPALAVEAERIAADLREKRRKADLARTSREAAEAEAEKAEKEIRVWRDEKVYIESLLGEFRRTAEQNELAPSTAPGTTAPSDPLAIGSRVVERLGLNRGILVEPGRAVAPDGTLTPGQFAEAGPVRLFLSDDGALAGIIGDGPDLRPKVVHPANSADSIRALIEGRAAPVEFDPTLGLAVELEKTETDLIEHTKAGGFWIYPILILAAVALLAALAKWIQLSKIREVPAPSVQRVISAVNAGDVDKARSEAERMKHPARHILEQGIAFVKENPGASRDDLEESLYERYLEAGPPLQRGLPLIAIAAATAPLLGLLGTVTGMMETFRLITVFGSGDARQLASGISEALITTEYGLVVAIPALILHALLSRKVQGVKSTMEMTSLAFLNGVKNEPA